MGGTLNLGSAFKMKATATGSQTVLSKIIRLVKEAQADKPPIQQLGDKVSAIFVPVVLGLATTAFFISWLVFHLPVAQALMNSIAMLVISCPCAMGLATPTAVIAGIGRAAKKGILVKGGSTLETFKGLRYMVFDKTGTLTDGKFKVEHLQVIDPAYAHRMGSVIHALEQQSSHPIAQSLVNHFSSHPPALLSSVKETKGIGMTGTDGDGHTWQLGSKRILASHSRTSSDFDLYLTRNHRLVAGLNLQDVLKKDARELICWLKKEGITPVLLSGDRRVKCERTAREAGITEWYAEQLPEQKLERIARMRLKGKTAMVGDGINDAPALAKADIGISLSNATQAAMFSAQVILLDAKQLIHIRTAILLGRHTLLTIRQNLFWAFFYNAAAIPIAALGLLNPMVAALAMAFSDVIVIGNSIRLKFKPLK